MRAAGKMMEAALQKAGASTVSMSSTESYSAMQLGVLDGVWTSSGTFGSYRLYEVSKYYNSPEDYSVYFTIEPIAISMRTWKKLTPEQQKIITEVGESLEQKAFDSAVADDKRVAGLFAQAGRADPQDDARRVEAVARAVPGRQLREVPQRRPGRRRAARQGHRALQVTRASTRRPDGVARPIAALDAFFRTLGLTVGLVTVAMLLMIAWGVVSREVLHQSDVWVTEGTTYLMGYMTFVGASVLAWQSRHLKVDFLHHHLGPRGQRALEIVSCVVVTVVACVLAWLTAAFWWDVWETKERSWGMLSLPLWIPYLSLFAGSVLLAFAQVARLATLFVASAAPPWPDPVDDASLVD